MKTDLLIEKVREKTEEILPGPGYFVVRISLAGGQGKKKLEVLVDGDKGIDIGVCSGISRRLSEWLDNHSVIDGSYELEVGSPGIDFPMQTIRQFRKNLGRKVKVVKNDNSVVKGRLAGVTGDSIAIEVEGRPNDQPGMVEELLLSQIRKSTVIVSLK
jgi:ribosome maturation factor RimP